MILIDILWMVGKGHHEGKMLGIRWAVVGPDYVQSRPEMLFLNAMCQQVGLEVKASFPLSGAWRLSFPGIPNCLVETKTSKDLTALAGVPYRGMVIAEAGKHAEGVLNTCRERVNEDFGWVFLCGTFEESKGPWYSRLAREWESPESVGQSWYSPSWENPVTYPLGRQDPRIVAEAREMPPEVFNERYGGRPQRPSRLLMKYADPKFHIRRRFGPDDSSYDPEQPVYLAIDPGIANAFSVAACQFDENTTWVIDCVHRWGRTVNQIVGECTRKPWASNVTDVIIDVAGNARRPEGDPVSKSWRRIWEEQMDAKLSFHSSRVSVDDGYEIHNTALFNAWPVKEANEQWNSNGEIPQDQIVDANGPRLFYDPMAAPPAFGGMVDGRKYAGEYNLHQKRVDMSGQVLSDKPIQRDCDLIKAMNYLLWWRYGPAGNRPHPRKRRRLQKGVAWKLG